MRAVRLISKLAVLAVLGGLIYMFEQSFYAQHTVPTPAEESDLFRGYEIKNWQFGPRIYKIIGISAIANLLAFVVVAQTSLLTMKGCDSPLVGRVCSVLDTVYVGSMLFGTDRDYIDAAYDPTRISDDAEITFVDVTGVTPPLSYPEGYFQVANPEQFAMAQDPMMALNNGMPDIDLNTIPGGSPQTDLFNTPQVLPQENPNAITGDLPSFNSTPSYTPPRPKTPRKTPRTNLPDIDDNDVAEAKPSPSPSVEPTPAATPSEDDLRNVPINKKPLVDFADDVAIKWETKEVDLNQPFTVVLNGVLAADGSLDLKKSKFDVAKQTGDQKMIDVGKAALEALGKSGYLTYLKNLNVEKFTATLVQNDEQITVLISSAQKTPEAAKTVASGLGLAISLGKQITEDPSDERTLLNGAKVSAEGKNFLLNFAIPKPIAQEMITRKLKEASAKKAAQPKPNGMNPVKAGDDSNAK